MKYSFRFALVFFVFASCSKNEDSVDGPISSGAVPTSPLVEQIDTGKRGNDVEKQALELSGAPSDQFKSLAEQLCLLDPEAALDSLRRGGSNTDVFRFLRVWLKVDVLAALDKIDILTGEKRQNLQVLAVKEMIKLGYLKESEDYVLGNLSGAAKSGAYTELVEFYANTDRLTDAERIMNSLPIGIVRRNLASNIAKELAQQDLSKAIDWVTELADDEKFDAAGSLGIMVDANSLQQSLSHGDILDPVIARSLLGRYAKWQEHSGKSLRSAVEEISGLAEKQELDKKATMWVVGDVLRVWKGRDPQELASFVADNLDSPAVSQRTVSTTIVALLDEGPLNALTWATELPGEYQGRTSAIEEAVDGWYDLNSLELSSWLATESSALKEDEEKIAVAHLVQRLSEDGDLEAAAAWAERL